MAANEETAEEERTTTQFQFLLDDRIRERNYKKVVVLYSAGGAGKDYYQQLTASGTDVYWVGENWLQGTGG